MGKGRGIDGILGMISVKLKSSVGDGGCAGGRKGASNAGYAFSFAVDRCGQGEEETLPNILALSSSLSLLSRASLGVVSTGFRNDCRFLGCGAGVSDEPRA